MLITLSIIVLHVIVILHAMINISRVFSRLVLINELLNSLLRLIELLEIIGKDFSFPVIIQESASIDELLVLVEYFLEHEADGGVVCQHHAVYFVGSLYVGAFLAEGYLDGSGRPVYKIGQFSLSYSLKGFMDLSWVYFSLDYVQN